jgi:hypothetical protein
MLGLICTLDFDLKIRVLFLPYEISGASYTHFFAGYFLATPDFYKDKKIVIRQSKCC